MTSTNLRLKTVLSLAALTILFSGGTLSAGPLTPPAGPVTSTGKTLTEVEPRIAINATNTPGDADSLFKITQPGSYYLTGNITGVANKHGIEIAASGVTIDLNGFDLVGIPGMGAFDAVATTVGGLTNITVHNGSCRSWGGDGIDLSTFQVNTSRVTDIHSSGNTGVGIRVGDSATVLNCTAKGNTSSGINVGAGCSVLTCMSNNNGSNGFVGSTSATFANCTAYQNTGAGFNLFAGSVVTNCTAAFNTSHGFTLINGSHISDCTALANHAAGIRATYGCTILNNTCDQNATGIHIVNSQNRIEGNNVNNGTLGYDIDGDNNFIIKNISSDNSTDWNIAVNNIYGPIINRTAPGSASVNGSSAVSTLGSTDANANYSF